MKHAICQVSVAPVRAESSDRSEMVTQCLFGEKVEVLKVQGNWIQIKADFDGYEGWCDHKQFVEVSIEEYESLSDGIYAAEGFNLAVEGDMPMTLPIGAHLGGLTDGKLQFGIKKFEYLGEILDYALTKQALPDLVENFLNTPYLWGGKSVFGIDCSGFVQQVYKMCGVKLPRDAYQQAEKGEALSFVEEAEPGDLAFFDNEEGRIIHVGIILEGNRIIHAHGKVRVDPIDITGIFNTDSQSYSHKLRVIKQVF